MHGSAMSGVGILYAFCLFMCSIFHVGSATNCPDAWIAFQGSCYFMHNDGKSFTDAEHYCNQHNSHLVHIDNAFENAFLKDRATHEYPQTNWWIGLSDEEVEGIYKWIDNNEMLSQESFTDWIAGQPDDYNYAEDCVHLYISQDCRWNDAQCNDNMAFICEVRPDESGPIVG